MTEVHRDVEELGIVGEVEVSNLQGEELADGGIDDCVECE